MPVNFKIEYGTDAAPRRAAFRDAKFRSIKFPAIKEAVLGKAYRLTLIFAPTEIMKKWNRIYRGKNTATDILSFPISTRQGEIYICPTEARKEAKKYDRPLANFIAFLFIHGLMHLKGYRHGATMEGIETKIRGKFGI
ncbi:MAG: putative rRNA maturation factor [Candidatus Parcubacteria bacterium]|jgi:probable rRNA maturation factor|nr:putative rRNA maturation factor [Candidatus Parcubacteria bacterium]